MSAAEIVTSLTTAIVVGAKTVGCVGEGCAAAGLLTGVAVGVGFAAGARGVVPRRGDCAARLNHMTRIIPATLSVLRFIVECLSAWSADVSSPELAQHAQSQVDLAMIFDRVSMAKLSGTSVCAVSSLPLPDKANHQMARSSVRASSCDFVDRSYRTRSTKQRDYGTNCP